ncbi:hypothetical protein PILCRDRAFT_814208 [Piloderma croceum F 1598]|uniref:Aip3p/Bud6 N-terminal domain-containing protein n=1 Tax=Piloderma croceum (strain F 1598) TaxID=765440 RepID=A0A0C3G977_PILCF|nr:hypothetical protein PILCRDRAFT_814208 [Piloderma croceum F 1598]
MHSQPFSHMNHTQTNGWKRQPPRSAGDVPTTVKNLLVATKQLQEVLGLWSVHQASETEVSNTYVTVGTEFNTAVEAFAHHKINLSEVHSVPKDLRNVLEQCLGEDPSPRTLAIYMPEVRQILRTLLQGLRSKQEAWRAVTVRRNVF